MNRCYLQSWPASTDRLRKVRKIGDEEAMVVFSDTLKPYTLPSVASGVCDHRFCVDFDLRNVSHSLDEPEPLGLGLVLVENETTC